MKLEHTFTRNNVTFGTDVAPVDDTYLTNDNVFNAPQYGVFSEPISSIALAYDGPVAAPDTSVVLYLWDEETTAWYQFASTTIPAGEIHYIALPNIIDRKDSRRASRISVAIVASPADVAPAGDYTFAMSSSTDQVGGGDSSAALAAIIALLTTIDGKIVAPEGTPEDMSGTRSSDGTTTTYMEMDPDSRWSLQFIPTNPDGSTSTLTVLQSNEDTGDETTATYTDVTDKFFGVSGFTTAGWYEPELPTGCIFLRIDVTVSGHTGIPSDPTWDLFAYKRNNS